jgi:uncharacterized membrane protein YczE
MFQQKKRKKEYLPSGISVMVVVYGVAVDVATEEFVVCVGTLGAACGVGSSVDETLPLLTHVIMHKQINTCFT